MANFSDAEAYFGKKSKKKKTLLLGSVDYISTHLFCDLAGIQKAIERKYINLFDNILVTANEVYGDVEKIFPELDTNICRERFDNINSINLAIWKNNSLAFRLSTGLVNKKLSNTYYLSQNQNQNQTLHGSKLTVKPGSNASL